MKSWSLLTVEFSVRLGRAAKALLMVQVSEREPCRGQTQPSPPNINLSAEGSRQSGGGDGGGGWRGRGGDFIV